MKLRRNFGNLTLRICHEYADHAFCQRHFFRDMPGYGPSEFAVDVGQHDGDVGPVTEKDHAAEQGHDEDDGHDDFPVILHIFPEFLDKRHLLSPRPAHGLHLPGAPAVVRFNVHYRRYRDWAFDARLSFRRAKNYPYSFRAGKRIAFRPGGFDATPI